MDNRSFMMNTRPRRAILRGALLGAAGTALSACTDSPAASPRASGVESGKAGGTVLLAYFSRAGRR